MHARCRFRLRARAPGPPLTAKPPPTALLTRQAALLTRRTALLLTRQVMWNTKMLARGRRVNREFAFISFRTQLQAARALHWMHGCQVRRGRCGALAG